MRSIALQKSAKGIFCVIFQFAVLLDIAMAHALTSCPTPDPVPDCSNSAYNCWTVNTSCMEASDASPGDGICETAAGNQICTFRAAIEEANAFSNKAEPDHIDFAIQENFPTIQVGVPLPAITQPTIIGQTLGISNKVILLGTLTLNLPVGLTLENSATVQNFVFQNFQTAVRLTGAGGNILKNNYIGTNETGSAAPVYGYSGESLRNWRGVEVTSPNNIISGNLISANAQTGIFLEGTNAKNNILSENRIGTDLSGNTGLGNFENGITLNQASNNLIQGNLISANGHDGISLQGSSTTNNQVLGNRIGVNAMGLAPLPNQENGISLLDASQNTIGGASATGRNLISANGGHGVLIEGFNAANNQVVGNLIGLASDGTSSLGNHLHGVLIKEGFSNQIGGVQTGEGNVISGNQQSGVAILGEGAFSNHLIGNYIGTNQDGSAPVANLKAGIWIVNSGSNYIGGAEDRSGNLISGNSQDGIRIEGIKAGFNVIQGNLIGVDREGIEPINNGQNGISLLAQWGEASGPTQNLIGGENEATRNLISGNGGDGVHLEGKGVSANVISGNLIGMDLTGHSPIGNEGRGIRITTGGDPNSSLGPPIANRIGGMKGVSVGKSCTGECNLISGNLKEGVLLDGIGVAVNQLEGNFIGTDISGTKAVPNQQAGVRLAGAHSNVIGGYPLDETGYNPRRNLISGNKKFGIEIVGALAKANQVYGNLIGTDVSGLLPLSNDGGVQLNLASGNKIGAGVLGSGNVISANQGNGVVLEEAHNNFIQGNQIGVGLDGNKPLGNFGHGIHIETPSTLNSIGGEFDGLGNHIAFNQDNGVLVSGLYNNRILGNSIHDNGKLAIDLNPIGVTTNDEGDVDLGVNLLQNYPVLTAVTENGGQVVIRGHMQGLPKSKYRLEFFSNQNCDPSGNGEGEIFLGADLITADDAGEVSFTVTHPLKNGSMITATATDESSNTSEFSACRQIGTGLGPDPDSDGVLDDVDNCPDDANSDQVDSDGDRKGDSCDICPFEFDHSDYDGDGIPDCAQHKLAGSGCALSFSASSIRFSVFPLFTLVILFLKRILSREIPL